MIQSRNRMYVFNKYNNESLLYISISNYNFDEKLSEVLSLKKYKMMRPIEFQNVLISIEIKLIKVNCCRSCISVTPKTLLKFPFFNIEIAY